MTSKHIYAFYVYMYLRGTDSATGRKGTPYYIGKGKGKRAFKKHKNEKNQPPKDISCIVIVDHFETEEEAFAAEKRLISYYGRVDIGTGILRNRTDGGEGGAGRIKSEEEKRNLSERIKSGNHPFAYLKRDTYLGKFGKDHPKTGFKHSEESRKRMADAKVGCLNPRFGKPSTIAGRKFTDEEKKNVVEANKKRSTHYIICICTGEKFESYKYAREWLVSKGFLKASSGPIQLAATGKRNSAYGFRWSIEKKREH